MLTQLDERSRRFILTTFDNGGVSSSFSIRGALGSISIKGKKLLRCIFLA
jgi:hypothetical protein